MGRAITMENRQDDLDRRLKLVEDALEEMIQTKVHHVDFHNDTKNPVTEVVVAKGVELKPDEEFTPPVGKRKKKSKEPKVVESLL